MGDLNRTMSDLSLNVAINGRIFTSTTTSSSSNRDVTGCYHGNSDDAGGNLTSSGYEAGTCWSRDDDVTNHSEDNGDSDDDDVRVSWSDSTGSQRASVARLYHLVSLLVLHCTR